MRHFKKFLILFTLFIFITWLSRQIKNSMHDEKYNSTLDTFVLWWTPILDVYFKEKQCGMFKCTFTVDRQFLANDKTKAILFYGSDLNYTDFPLPRLPQHSWALFHEESPKNIPYLQYDIILKHFNFTSTFSRHSDFPLTTHYLNNIDLLTTRKYLIPIGDKSKYRIKDKLAPVAYVQSICDTMSGRDDYVKELMNYIDIDSYGKCLNNKKLPETLTNDYLRTIDSDEFYKFLARYKFIIAYENGVCDDYISEKFWRPLIIGSVPIYYGSPLIEDWLPNPKSVILIKDFNSPKELATYIKFLDNNDTEYNKYLDHKYSIIEPITNNILIKTMLEREYNKENLFEDFECFVCKKIHNNRKILNFANQKHYNCGEHLTYPKMSTNLNNNDWHSIVKHGKCQANVLNKFLLKNQTFHSKEFDKELVNEVQNGGCIL